MFKNAMNENGEITNSQISRLQDEVEELKEELHSINIKYSSKIAIEKDAIEEIEILQKNLEAEKLNQKTLTYKFEEEIKHTNKKWKNEIETLKVEYEDQAKNDTERREHLEKELMLCKDRLNAEAEALCQKKSALEMMSETLHEEVKRKEEAESIVKMMKCKLEEMEQKLTELLQIKETKEEEVASLKEQLIQAEEDAALYSSQMRELQVPQKDNELVCNDPSSKGNSLFAEVDDRRQLMKQQLLVEKNKIINLKRGYKAKCSQVQHLQAQLTDVTRKWKEDAKDTISSQDTLIFSLRCRVKELEAQSISSPKNEYHGERADMGRSTGEPLDAYKYMEIEVERGREEIKQLKETLNQFSIGKLLGDEEMYKLKTELRRLRAENAHFMRIAGEQKASSRDDKHFGVSEIGDK